MEKSAFLDPKIIQYVNKYSLRLNQHQQKMIEKTMKLRDNEMLGSADEIQFFQLLLKSTKAKRVLELGTYTGYTTMSLAMALPDDGKIVSCDITDKSIQYDIWKEAGVEHKIDLKLGNAVETLDNLISNGQSGAFDFAFIDADKDNYINYYERCLKLVKKGGIIAVDNVLWDGLVVKDESEHDLWTQWLHSFNKHVQDDDRVDMSMLAIADGVSLFYVK